MTDQRAKPSWDKSVQDTIRYDQREFLRGGGWAVHLFVAPLKIELE